MSLRLWHSPLFAIMTSCAATPAGPVESTPIRVDDSPPKVPSGSEALDRPSRAIREHWPFERPPSLVVYADFAELGRTELVRALVPASLEMAKDQLSEAQQKCIREAVASAKEIAVGAATSTGRFAVVVRFDPAAWPSTPDACLGELGETHAAHIDGAQRGRAFRRIVVASDRDVLVAGTPNLVRAAFAGHPKAAPPHLSLEPGQYLAWSFAAPDESFEIKGALTTTPERFGIHVAVDVSKPGDAAELERLVQRVRHEASQPLGPNPESTAFAKRILDAFEMRRIANHFDFGLDLTEPPRNQAFDIGQASTLAIYGVRRYLSQAKIAEARNTVSAIAKDYISSWHPEPPAPKKTKFVSLPPVPPTVPQAMRYQSSPAEWEPWHEIRFSMTDPQFFQYEVRASKNGKTAEIIARGDLDGDGKTSNFSLKLEIDRDGELRVSPVIVETDPEE